MSKDTIANMLTCIHNANLKRTKTVEFPATNTTRNIGNILLKSGFIKELRIRQEDQKSFIIITLQYQDNKRKPYINTVRRISKPGVRVYASHKDIPKILAGVGIVILSTSQGIIIDREAREKKIGGEILCYIW